MNISAFLDLLLDIELSERNGNYQRLVFDRVTSYCELVSKAVDDLTLSELRSISDACSKEFNFGDAA